MGSCGSILFSGETLDQWKVAASGSLCVATLCGGRSARRPAGPLRAPARVKRCLGFCCCFWSRPALVCVALCCDAWAKFSSQRASPGVQQGVGSLPAPEKRPIRRITRIKENEPKRAKPLLEQLFHYRKGEDGAHRRRRKGGRRSLLRS